jgi:hypothetical protein
MAWDASGYFVGFKIAMMLLFLILDQGVSGLRLRLVECNVGWNEVILDIKDQFILCNIWFEG